MKIVIQILEILSSLASIWIACIATRALKTWKHQTLAQIKLTFLDDLTNTVTDYIQEMNTPIQILKFINISMECHSDVLPLNNDGIENSGLIQYIEGRGKDDQKILKEFLEKLRPKVSKIDSLKFKGQAMGFDDYTQCHDACTILVWSFKQIDAFVGFVGMTNLDWQNQSVQETLNTIKKVNSESIKTNIDRQSKIFLAYVTKIYSTILT